MLKMQDFSVSLFASLFPSGREFFLCDYFCVRILKNPRKMGGLSNTYFFSTFNITYFIWDSKGGGGVFFKEKKRFKEKRKLISF